MDSNDISSKFKDVSNLILQISKEIKAQEEEREKLKKENFQLRNKVRAMETQHGCYAQVLEIYKKKAERLSKKNSELEKKAEEKIIQICQLFEKAITRLKRMYRVDLSFNLGYDKDNDCYFFDRFCISLLPEAVIKAISRLLLLEEKDFLSFIDDRSKSELKKAIRERRPVYFYDGFDDLGCRLSTKASLKWITKNMPKEESDAVDCDDKKDCK